MTPKDHPAFHSPRRRDSISERVSVERNITSSMGSFGGLSMVLLYRVFRGVYEKIVCRILYGIAKYMNLFIICFWPRRRKRWFFDTFKIVPGFFSKKILYFFPPSKLVFYQLKPRTIQGKTFYIFIFIYFYRILGSYINNVLVISVLFFISLLFCLGLTNRTTN